MSMRAHHTCISVADIDATAEWYQRALGFETERAFQIPSGARVALLASPGGARVELTELGGGRDGNQWNDPPKSLEAHGLTHIAFEVEDLDGAFEAAVAHGAAAVWEPRDGMGGMRMAFLHDNEGNLVELLSLTGASI
jgi:catechol 2,3-dioxygenase-like lactoylglutathione lyase family enzyme